MRGLSPYPGAWTDMKATDGGKDYTVKIFKTVKTDKPSNGKPGTIVVVKNHLLVNTANNLLEITLLQLSGKKRMETSAFLNGFHAIENYRFE